MTPFSWEPRLFLAAALLLIASATLLPGESAGGVPAPLCLFCGWRSGADFVSNVLLFMPLGAALAAGRGAGRRGLAGAVLVGGALSLGIELAQVTLVAGRYATLRDLAANTLGSAAGWLAWRGLWARPPRRGGAWALAWSAAVSTLLLAGLWANRPAPPKGADYYLQWTARFGNMAPYEGRVLESRVGALELTGPPWRIEATDRVRALLRGGAGVAARVEAGPPPPALAPVLSLYDALQREVFLLGVDGDDLVYRYRTLGQALRFDGPDVRFEGAMRGVEAGEVVPLVVAFDGDRHCARAGAWRGCARPATVGGTWTLLHRPWPWMGPLRRVADLAWLAVILFPVGLLARTWTGRAAAGGVALLLLGLGPPALGFAWMPPGELAAAAAGIAAAGVVASRWRPMPFDTDGRRASVSRHD